MRYYSLRLRLINGGFVCMKTLALVKPNQGKIDLMKEYDGRLGWGKKKRDHGMEKN